MYRIAVLSDVGKCRIGRRFLSQVSNELFFFTIRKYPRLPISQVCVTNTCHLYGVALPIKRCKKLINSTKKRNIREFLPIGRC
jgi:hypothetical protein